MKREPVQSRAIRSVGWDRLSQVLEIEFAAGTIYQYSPVSEFTFRALMHAESKHAFFTNSIDGKYECRQVR